MNRNHHNYYINADHRAMKLSQFNSFRLAGRTWMQFHRILGKFPSSAVLPSLDYFVKRGGKPIPMDCSGAAISGEICQTGRETHSNGLQRCCHLWTNLSNGRGRPVSPERSRAAISGLLCQTGRETHSDGQQRCCHLWTAGSKRVTDALTSRLGLFPESWLNQNANERAA